MNHAVVSVIMTMTIGINSLYFAYIQNEILKGNVFKKKKVGDLYQSGKGYKGICDLI